MKRILIIIFCFAVLLSLSACEDTSIEGPYVDSYFIESFPFTSELLSDASAWIAGSNNYETEETDILNNTLTLRYEPNDVWWITASRGAGDGIYGIDGFYVLWAFVPELSATETEAVYQEIVDELSCICGDSVRLDMDGNSESQTFYYYELKVKVRMYHHSDSSELSLEMYVEE